jgi:hypothetical protein
MFFFPPFWGRLVLQKAADLPCLAPIRPLTLRRAKRSVSCILIRQIRENKVRSLFCLAKGVSTQDRTSQNSVNYKSLFSFLLRICMLCIVALRVVHHCGTGIPEIDTYVSIIIQNVLHGMALFSCQGLLC